MLLPIDPLVSAPLPVRSAFLSVMREVVQVDGVIEGREHAFLLALARQLELDHRTVEDPADLEVLHHVANLVLLQAALLAACDGDVHGAEIELLKDLEARLNATPGLADRAIRWAVRGIRWFAEAQWLVQSARADGYAEPDEVSPHDAQAEAY